MDFVLHGKTAALNQLAFEVRYSRGWTYLDKCGRTMNRIFDLGPEWISTPPEPDPTGTRLVNFKTGHQLTFGPRSFVSTLQRPSGQAPISSAEFEDYIIETHLLSEILIESLGLRDFTRIGFRTWYLFPFATKAAAESWIADLGLYSTNQALTETFDATIEATAYTVVLGGRPNRLRIALSTTERQAELDLGKDVLQIQASTLPRNQREHLLAQEKARRRIKLNPEFASLLDLDVSQEQPLAIDAADFIRTSQAEAADGVRKVIEP